MSQAELQLDNSNRPALIKKGRYLEYFTIGYNSLEGLIAVAAGLMASSIALVGFGFDSLIEEDLRVERAVDAERFIEDVGFANTLTDARRAGPSLHIAVCGRRDVSLSRNV